MILSAASVPASTPATQSLQELSPRERLAALFDMGSLVELAGPFDRIRSPWLAEQGMISQADDGTVVVHGRIDQRDVVAVAIDHRHEGGSIGEVGGAKIVAALHLAAQSCRSGRPTAALLLLETGGVRLQEATLGLAAIAEIHQAIVELRELAPVLAVIAGPTGCFGGMSLAAALCTKILATRHGRLGMNGAEVIEQEAGPQELDASDRELVWRLIGSEARLRDGFIDALFEDDTKALADAVRAALQEGPGKPARLMDAPAKLLGLRDAVTANGGLPRLAAFDPFGPSAKAASSQDRGRTWLMLLSSGEPRVVLGTPSVLEADVSLGPEAADTAIALALSPHPGSLLPRATQGELGLEQAWTLAARVRSFVTGEQGAMTKRPILAIVDSPGQAFGHVEEQRCISVAAAAVVDAYAEARRAGHIILTLIVGRAVSGAFLAHGMQSDYICALAGDGVTMHAMSLQSVARITRRSLAEVQANAARILPMSYDIRDAYRLGLIDDLLPGIRPDAPTSAEVQVVIKHLSNTLSGLYKGSLRRRSVEENPLRQATVTVGRAVRDQWPANKEITHARKEEHVRRSSHPH